MNSREQIPEDTFKFLGIAPKEKSVLFDPHKNSSEWMVLDGKYKCRWWPGKDEYEHVNWDLSESMTIEIPDHIPLSRYLGDKSKVDYNDPIVDFTTKI